MNQPQISKALNGINDDLLTEAMDLVSQRNPHRLLRWSILAACLILLIGAVTVTATTDLGTQLLQSFIWENDPDSPYTESGYTLQFQIQRIPTSALTGQIQDVPTTIRLQYKNHKLWYNTMPNHYMRKFPSAADAKAFIGLDGLHIPDWELEESYASFSAYSADASGEIEFFTLELFYQEEDINIQSWATVYTQVHESDTVSHNSIYNQALTYTESTAVNNKGLEYHIVTNSPMESGYQGLHGFMVYEGILYQLNVSYQAQDSAQAEDILHQWADQFGAA